MQISQEAGQVVWYSHLFQNFPQFIVIHTVKDFGIVNKAEIDVFLKLSCFFDDPAGIATLFIYFPSPLLTLCLISLFVFPSEGQNIYKRERQSDFKKLEN